MNKKFGLFYCFALLVSLMTTSCNSDDDLVGNWVVAPTDFAGSARGYAASFVVDNNLYVFGGYDGDYNFNDLWRLDLSTEDGSWEQLASLTDSTATVSNTSTAHYKRKYATAFAIDTDGYVGTGWDGDDYMKDFWKYDTETDSWTQIADFPGTARYGCYAFTLGSTGYVGGGKGYTSTANSGESYFNEMYSYDPTSDSWTSVDVKGHKRAFASVFVIDDVAYIFGGYYSSGVPNDMWSFDGTTWTQKAYITNYTDKSFDDDYTTIARYNGATFVINGKGYVTCGTSSSGSFMKYTWEYNPTTDRWKEKTSFEKTVRTGAVAATLSTGAGIVLTGNTGSTYLEDVNYFYPTEDYDSND